MTPTRERLRFSSFSNMPTHNCWSTGDTMKSSQRVERAYDSLDHPRGLFSSWKLAAEAKRFNGLRLEITELTERTDNAIKFLSDMFYARVYQLASSKIGVNDYRHIVDDKQRIARQVYDS